jgi:hypothetical protein
MANKLELLLRKAGRELADYQVARIFKVPEEMSQTPCDFFRIHGIRSCDHDRSEDGEGDEPCHQ